jgi:tungstate transport system substrate-binding protein
MRVHWTTACRWTLVAVLLLSSGCSRSTRQSKPLRLATTTSTRDSGLLDVLVPMFEKKTGIEVHVIAAGSGQALELGRRGDADVLLTHSPDAEKLFVKDGHGEERQPAMHNDFVLVGPETDPAGIKGKKSSIEAFRQIANSCSPFVSRGDESGTHVKEKKLWNEVQNEPEGDWYLRAGTGMAEVLRMADEKRAYTLADRGTYLTQRDKLSLAIIVEGDALLRNPYSVIVVSSEKHPQVSHEAARQFAEFLLSPDVQRTIGDFGVDQFGQALFFPDAGSPR